jgi:thiosulfate/3-mercaptopyruvate sulfurtransferase
MNCLIVHIINTVFLVIILTGCSGTIFDGSDQRGWEYTTGGWIDSSYVVSPEWVNAHLSDLSLIVIDTREESVKDRERIPGALDLHWTALVDLSTSPVQPGYGLSYGPEKISHILDSMGVDTSKTVVVYNDPVNGWAEDGRVLWVLRLAGIHKSKFINGGLNSWQAKGFPTSKNRTLPRSSSGYRIMSFDSSYTVDGNFINRRIPNWNVSSSNLRLIDSREKSEYNGSILYGEKRGGHIPGARWYWFKDLIHPDGTVKSQVQLDSIFTSLGIKRQDTVVAYCTGGVRSADVTIFLRMAGYPNSRNYDGSWWDWAATDEFPVANNSIK